MITIRIPSYLLPVLRDAFNGAADSLEEWEEAPLDPGDVVQVRQALDEAEAGALPGLPVVLALGSANELFCLKDGFEIGAEPDPAVTDAEVAAIAALLDAVQA
jgi:hypothetical protein